MIRHLVGRDAHPEPVPADSEHVGDMVNAWCSYWNTEDGLLEVGFQDFSGEKRTPHRDGYEQIMIVLEGTGTIETEGQSIAFEPGDVIVESCPLAPKRTLSAGCRMVYVSHFRSPAWLARRGSVAALRQRESAA